MTEPFAKATTNSETLVQDRRAFLKTTGFLALAAATALNTDPAQSAMPTLQEVFADPDIPILGNAGGDVTIVEYFDYQCPFCKRTHPVLEDAVRRDGRVRLVMKDWPIFGDPSPYASKLVLGATGTAGYEAGMAALMATPARLTLDEVDQALASAGLDPKAMWSTYERNAAFVEAILSRNASQAEGFRLSGTPAFVIGTRVYGGALDSDGFDQAIKEARNAQEDRQ